MHKTKIAAMGVVAIVGAVAMVAMSGSAAAGAHAADTMEQSVDEIDVEAGEPRDASGDQPDCSERTGISVPDGCTPDTEPKDPDLEPVKETVDETVDAVAEVTTDPVNEYLNDQKGEHVEAYTALQYGGGGGYQVVDKDKDVLDGSP